MLCVYAFTWFWIRKCSASKHECTLGELEQKPGVNGPEAAGVLGHGLAELEAEGHETRHETRQETRHETPHPT